MYVIRSLSSIIIIKFGVVKEASRINYHYCWYIPIIYSMTATTNDAIIFWPLPFTDTVPSDYRSLQPLISSTQRRVFLVIDSPWLQNQLRDKEVQGGHHRQQQRQEEEEEERKKTKKRKGRWNGSGYGWKHF